MKRGKRLDPKLATPPPGPGVGLRIVYCHHAGGMEAEAHEELRPERSGYRTLWAWAVCQVDSRRGGYVREMDAAGNVVRQHPAAAAQVP